MQIELLAGWPQVRRWITRSVLAPLLLASGCLFSKIGYDNAETLARWTVNDYVDLDSGQRRELDEALHQIHRWHRREELPAYGAIALEVARRIERRISLGDLDWAEAAFRARYDALLGNAAGQLVGLVSTIKPFQLSPMDQKFARGNAKFREDYLTGTRESRLAKRIDEALELIEDWVGGLDAEQKRRLTAKLAALPETAEDRYAQRLVRQRVLRELIAIQPPRDSLIAGLSQWLIGWEAGRSAEYQRVYGVWLRQSRQVVLDLDLMLTARQRVHLVEKLRELAADFVAWSKKPS